MRTNRLGFARGLLSLFVLLLLVACGGGGGGGGGPAPVVYAGNTNAAAIAPANASQLTANVFGNEDAASIILGVSSESSDATQDRGSGAMDVSIRLNRFFRETVVRVERASSAQRAARAVTVNQTIPCDSGSVHTSGTLNDNGTGTLSMSFNDCRIGDGTLNGPATVRVDAVDMSSFVPTDLTVSFVRLTLRGPGVSVDVGGSLRAQLIVGTISETITQDLVSLNNITGRMTKTENLRFENIQNTPSSFTSTVSGRIFDQIHGYVDITTVAQLAFGILGQLFPDSGQIVLTGAGNSSILVSALSSTMVWLELDRDGDGVREITAFLKWTELSGPVGADLADNDSDGMHNSWETAHIGLNPIAADAAVDGDGDTYSNLREYMGGGDPNDVAVVPSLGKASLTIATTAEPIVGKSGLASDGAKYLLVSCRATGIFGVFVSGATAGEPFPIASGNCTDGGIGSPDDITLPNAAFDGTNYLVVFVKGENIYGTRVTQSGTVLDGPSGFAISTGVLFSISNWSPAVAFDGTAFLVVWNKYNGLDHDIYGARVTSDGQAQGEFAISTAPGSQVSADVSFDGVNYLVVWNDSRNGNNDIFGARVEQNGTVLDPLGIPISITPSSEDGPRIAFDGSNYLVVWRDVPNIGFDPPLADIRGTRIDPVGALLDGPAAGGGIGINTIALGKSEPAVAFDGRNFLVAWVVGAFPNSPPAGMFGAKVSPGGQVVEGLPATAGISLSNPPSAFARFLSPVITSNGTSVLLTWFDNNQLAGQPGTIPGSLVFP